MDTENNFPGNYRIEVSGWGLDQNFFLEQTNLLWSLDGEKSVRLHRELIEGAMVFVRLLAPEPSVTSLPVTYEVSSVQPMSCNGLCGMRLRLLQPRLKESITGLVASKLHEESERGCEAGQNSRQPEVEEILQ